jgi:hypothetical protein
VRGVPCLALATLTWACACQNLSAQGDGPAVIANPGEASRSEIQSVLSEALGERSIRIADDALTQSSILTLEGAVRGDPAREAPRGRDLGGPERFDLVLDNGRCFLVYRGSGRRWRLHETECRPIN